MATSGRWDRIKSAVLDNVVSYILAAVVSGVAAGAALYPSIKAIAGRWAPYLVAYTILFVFLAVLLSVNQVQQIAARARMRKAANRTPAMIESQIREWLYGFGFEIKDDAKPSSHFQMVARDDQGMRIVILQNIGRPYITIATTIVLANDEIGNRARATLANPRSTVLNDLAIQLAQLGVEFDLQGSPMERIVIQHKVIFDETMTALKIYREMMLVRRGLGLAQNVFDQAGKILDSTKGSAKEPGGI
jgi:hypothetical protein